MSVPASLITWLVLASAVPGPVRVTAEGQGVAEIADFVRARAAAAWGAEVLAGEADAASWAVVVARTSPEQCAVEVRERGVVLASRTLQVEPVELAMLEAWLVVRATLERDEVAGDDGAAPGPGSAARTDDPTPPIAGAGGATPPIATATIAAAGRGSLIATASVAAADRGSPALAERADLGAGDATAHGRTELDAAATSTAASHPTLAAASDGHLIDTWGVLLASQLAGATRGGLAVEVRRAIAPRVTVGARVGVEWSTPLADASVVGVPITGMVGWAPVVDLPIELGTYVQLMPLGVSVGSDAAASGLGLSASLGGYTRAAFDVGPVTLVGELALGLPLIRQTYVSTTEEARDPVLELRFAAGVQWRWP